MHESTNNIGTDHHCLKCGYSLRGLPDIHTCPECGLDYDLNRIVIPIGGYRRIIKIYLPLITILLPLLALFPQFTRIGLSTRQIVIMATVILMIVIHILRIVPRRHLYLTYLALDSKGVHLFHANGEVKHYAWPDIDQARGEWFGGNFHLVGKDGIDLFSCNGDDLGGWSKTKQCISAINAARERFQDQNL